MQQLFSTRNYSVRDFEDWQERNELTLAPKFQRRDVWNDKAKSYLIDTIVRGKPIPKLYMRQNVIPGDRKTQREIVDGQQRLRAVLSFLKDGFKISNAHHRELGGKYFSQLDEETQRDILRYEFSVDLLQDMPDNDVYDIFARINTHSATLKSQELRNAKWFGDFRSCAYLLAQEFLKFLETNNLFTHIQIVRMVEVEFISELLLAMQEGVRESKKSVIDKAYRDYDDEFPNREQHEERFRVTMDVIGAIAGNRLPSLKFRATRLFYPLFCCVYHMKFSLPKLKAPRTRLLVKDYPKLMTILENVDEMVTALEVNATPDQDVPPATAPGRQFFDAYSKHWVHATNRTILTRYLCEQFVGVLR